MGDRQPKVDQRGAARGTFDTTGLEGTSAAARVHDHEGLLVLPRYKPFITPEPFMKASCQGECGEYQAAPRSRRPRCPLLNSPRRDRRSPGIPARLLPAARGDRAA